MVISVSSLEHDGLGRYGDARSRRRPCCHALAEPGHAGFASARPAQIGMLLACLPYLLPCATEMHRGAGKAEKHAVGQVVEVGGRVLVAVPVGADLLRWNMHRIYGKVRLPVLLRGWTILAAEGWHAALLSQVHPPPCTPRLAPSPLFFGAVVIGAGARRSRVSWGEAAACAATQVRVHRACVCCVRRRLTPWHTTSPSSSSKTRLHTTTTLWYGELVALPPATCDVTCLSTLSCCQPA